MNISNEWNTQPINEQSKLFNQKSSKTIAVAHNSILYRYVDKIYANGI